MSELDEQLKKRFKEALKNIQASKSFELPDDKESKSFAKKEEQNWPNLDQLAA